MSEYFLTDDFLLQGKVAKRLYHDHVKHLPIIDYHCHLAPDEIAADKQFNNLTDIWLKGDHYKWRAQRSLGVSEKMITGEAGDEEKFHAWAKVVPQTVRNPLFHWTHMELKNVFGVTEYLNEKSASSIYASCNDFIKKTFAQNKSHIGIF
jgi:glucuronate isomerase